MKHHSSKTPADIYIYRLRSFLRRGTAAFTAFALSLTLLTGCGEDASSAGGSSAPSTSSTTTSVTDNVSVAPESVEDIADASEDMADVSVEENEQSEEVEEEIRTGCITFELDTYSDPSNLSQYSALGTLLVTYGLKDPNVLKFGAMSDYVMSGGNITFIEAPDPINGFVSDWGCYPSYWVHLFSEEDWYTDDLTSCETSVLYESIDNNVPVMVWITEYLRQPEEIYCSGNVTIYDPLECVILTAYTHDTVTVWSPIQNGYVEYKKKRFERIFEAMGSMALTIVKK